MYEYLLQFILKLNTYLLFFLLFMQPESHNQQPPSQGPQNSLSISNTILITAVIIAVSIFFSGRSFGGVQKVAGTNAQAPVSAAQPAQVPAGQVGTIKPVSKEDHIRGDINAPVVIVEFSDTECPFCKSFHQTLQQIMSEYGSSGKVAWVYR